MEPVTLLEKAGNFYSAPSGLPPSVSPSMISQGIAITAQHFCSMSIGKL